MLDNLTPLSEEAGTVDKFFNLNCVYGPEKRQAAINSSVKRGLPFIVQRKEHNKKVAIVASGPSATDYVDDLKNFDGEIWGVNGAFQWMRHRGIKPTAFIGLDPEEILKEYLIERPDDVTYYLAAQVHPDVFDHLEGKNVRLWFPADSEVKFPSGAIPIFGGSTCLGRAPNLAYVLGYRDVHIFGGDSSFKDKSHVYGESGEVPAGIFLFECNGKLFITTRQMLQQACEFTEQLVEWARPGTRGETPLSATIYGDGLMQWMFKQNFDSGAYGQYIYDAVGGGKNRHERRALRRAQRRGEAA